MSPSACHLKLNTPVSLQFTVILVPIYESCILISRLILSCFFNLIIFCSLYSFPPLNPFFFLKYIWENFSKFTVQITYPLLHSFFRVVVKYFYVLINYIFYSNHIPLLDHSLFSPSKRFSSCNNLCIKCSSTWFYIIHTYPSYFK